MLESFLTREADELGEVNKLGESAKILHIEFPDFTDYFQKSTNLKTK